MNEQVKEKLAESLTADNSAIIPFLPYLLQDFWELGSSPEDMLLTFRKHIPVNKDTKVLDLGCGKGAVSVQLAKALGIRVKGVDILPQFIEYAKNKAQEYGVSHLCAFEVADANVSVNTERDYDCVIFGAVGDILGDYKETIMKLLPIIKSGGFILIDDAYVLDQSANEQLKFERTYPTYDEWDMFFKELGLTLVECKSVSDDDCDIEDDCDSEKEMNWIIMRANELIEKHPAHKSMFEQYIENQRNEYTDLRNDLIGATWLLQK